MQKVVEVHNLTKKYGKILAVDDISFEVNQNEIFGLIGPNGAGKSTTLRIVATIVEPTGGTVRVDGYDTKDDSKKIRQVITYLPEEAGAYKNMRGLAYLKFMAALYSDDSAKQKEFVDAAVAIADLKERINDKIKTYSKGMARKVLLSRAVMTKPHLAILDEPTSGLDVTNSLIIRTIIRSLAKQGMAVLLSSHNMLEVEFLSDRVGIISQGKIIEMGTPSRLKTKYNAANLEEVFTKITGDFEKHPA